MTNLHDDSTYEGETNIPMVWQSCYFNKVFDYYTCVTILTMNAVLEKILR